MNDHLRSIVDIRQFAINKAVEISNKAKYHTVDDIIKDAKVIENYIKGKFDIPAITQDNTDKLYDSFVKMYENNVSKTNNINIDVMNKEHSHTSVEDKVKMFNLKAD